MTERAGDHDGGDSACETLLSEAADEFLERVQRGEQPEVEDYAERYPEVAEALRDVLPALRAMHEVPSAPESSGDAAPEIGGRLGDFRILRELGRGGMGVVYEAEQISLQRRVALKILPFAAALDRKRLERFKNEAQAGAKLHHSHIVPVYAVGCERGVYYYAMQMIEGLSLADVIAQLRQFSAHKLAESTPARVSAPDTSNVLGSVFASAGPRPATAPHDETRPHAARAFSTVPASNATDFFRAIARMGAQAADALEHAHGLAVIHRDIKPANLLVDVRGDLWVTDFGLARLREDNTLTMTGDVVGTYRYMSPEQALGRHGVVDHRTDIYSLGATLYELLTLRPLFDGHNREEVVASVTTSEPVAPRRINRAVPADLETIVLKALSKEPRDRYATAGEMADDLRRFLDSRPIQAKRPTTVERVRKWSRRHRTVVGWSVLILLLAVLGLTVSNVMIARERSKTRAAYEEVARKQNATEEALAEQARQRELAQSQFRQAREMLDFFVQTSVEDLADQQPSEDIRARLLQASLEYYQGFIEQSRDNPPLQAELAASHVRVARILEAVGATPAARAALERALETQERLVRARPADEALRRGLFFMYFHLGVLRGGMPFYVISKASVQSHLGLTAEQVAHIRQVTEQQDRIRREFCQSRSTDLARMRGELREQRDAAQRELEQILDERQRARLRQIVLQWQGTWAFGDREVADQLALTPAQRSRIWSIQEELRQHHGFRGPPRSPSIQERVEEVLTAKQREEWRQMLGEPFKHDRPKPPGRPPRAKTARPKPAQADAPKPAQSNAPTPSPERPQASGGQAVPATAGNAS
jgi:serine/threonine protein kinase